MFDDRLATVLRTPARSETAARTQFRQVLDLLGTSAGEHGPELTAAAYARLGELAELVPALEQSQILRAPGVRLRNPALVAWLADGEPQAAAAAMATARLAERDWLALIPRLPITARGFLRHRRDLPLAVRQVLERLGVRDLVLPNAAGVPAATAPERDEPAVTTDSGIGALVRRIEAFQAARRATAPSPEPGARREPRVSGVDFATDALGTVTSADPAVAPLLVGLSLTANSEVARLDEAAASALKLRQPIAGGLVELDLAEPMRGTWQVDAAPLFDFATGAFLGHAGRLRRPGAAAEVPDAGGGAGDRMRQVLHELRTPVNAIQGFAEIIQQQLFGAVPHEYRALAAGIAVDAARLMAGFDDLDRLARLDSGALDMEPGASDLKAATAQLLRRLDGVLRPRSARLILAEAGSSFDVPLDEREALALLWRMLATLAGALAPGEVAELQLSSDGNQVSLRAELPAALLEGEDIFAAALPAQARAVSAGMFGPGFAFRLARAEAIAAGGDLTNDGDALVLVLPALTAPPALHTVESDV